MSTQSLPSRCSVYPSVWLSVVLGLLLLGVLLTEAGASHQCWAEGSIAGGERSQRHVGLIRRDLKNAL
jgi:hypothetical protein